MRLRPVTVTVLGGFLRRSVLPNYSIYLKPMIDGVVSAPFSAEDEIARALIITKTVDLFALQFSRMACLMHLSRLEYPKWSDSYGPRFQ